MIELDVGFFDYKVVESAEEFEKLKLEGWRLDQFAAKNLIDPVVEIAFPQAESKDSRTVADVDTEIKAENALIAEQVDNMPPTREELEAKANELGISFTAKTKDDVLNEKINQALNKAGE